jgi:hypothetical protein
MSNILRNEWHIEKWVTYWEMSNILRNELYIRITFVVWDFIEKYFWKGSRFQFLEFVFENLQGFLFIPSYRICYRIYWSGCSLHLHILWEIIWRVLYERDFLNGCCMGFYEKYFRKGSHILFWNLFFENLQGFLLIPSYRIIYTYGILVGCLHRRSSQGGLHMRSYIILIQKWVTYWEIKCLYIIYELSISRKSTVLTQNG